MIDCLFCKIVNGEIPSNNVAEDEKTLVFEDINPKAPVHLLVIPKEHIDYKDSEIDYSIFGDLMAMAKKVAKEKGIDDGGFRLILNSGPDAGQEVDHLHLHVLGGTSLGKMICI